MSSKSKAMKSGKAAKARKAPAKKSVHERKHKPAVAAQRKTAKVVKKHAPARKPAVAARKPARAARKPAPAVAQKAAVSAQKKAPAAVAAPKPVAVKVPSVQATKPVGPAKPAQPAAPVAVKPVAVKPVAAVAVQVTVAVGSVPAGQNGVPAKKPTPPRSEFKISEHIVYPAHGVGRIMGIETQEVAGLKLDLFVISFVKDKMTLRVPVAKASIVGMRKLADNLTVKRALETVRGRARIKRTMWSRRAQEYEAKINSGDLIAIAEVVRDLFRSDTQPEQSYSERQLYEAALDRMSREISSVNRISETEAIRQIEQNLAKSPRRGAKPEGVVEPGSEQAPREEAA
jgi:CarD family transcriptional regulator